LPKLALSLLIHGHQPVGNFDDVLERAYQDSYLAFAKMLQAHPKVRIGLHYSGCLLQWMEKHYPEFFELLRELVKRNQVELVGGGFYEPILISIPFTDRLDQIRFLSDYIEKHFGRRPQGAWLAERVWEPQLPSTLAAAGVDYTLVDDMHFLAAGFEPEQLFGYSLCEDLGASVKVLPGLKKLRYLIPFDSVENNIAFLKEAAAKHPGGLAAMGDDNEKFGVWPETYKHCYTNGWLERFFSALEENSDWLACVPPGDYVAENPPMGRADLPTASYSEMMEWALPTPARQRFHSVLKEFSSRPEVHDLLRGSTWRNFFSKYAESNLLHKKMLHVSAKIGRLGADSRHGAALRRAQDSAAGFLLRAQCNDAYWHGIFGGLYAPHLRTSLWRDLIRAEKIADAAEQGRASYAELARLDFDADGREELYVTSESCAALFKPSDGATLAALDFRASDATLVNSIMRRVEPYHARLREAGAPPKGAAVSIHEQFKVKEPGLEQRLRYDVWPRHSHRLLLFPANKTHADFEALRLEASTPFAAGNYNAASATAQRLDFQMESSLALAAAEPAQKPAPISLRASKMFSLAPAEKGFILTCEVWLASRGKEPLRLSVGLEIILNLLAPSHDDRYFAAGKERRRLGWSGELPAPVLRAVDEWQDVAVQIEAPGARGFWIAPVETVSESEDGFERVYQGSQILPVWSADLGPGKDFIATVTYRAERLRG
jgi:alpha-amylase